MSYAIAKSNPRTRTDCKAAAVIISEVVPEILPLTQFSVLTTPSMVEKPGSSGPCGLHLYFSAQKSSL